MNLVMKVLAVVVLVAAVVVVFIGVTLKSGGLLERGLLFAGAVLLVLLATRLQRRPA